MKVLFTGGNGQLAKELSNISSSVDFDFIPREELNLIDRESITRFVENTNCIYDAIVCGAYRYPAEAIENDQNLDYIKIPINHLWLYEKLGKKAKCFIHFTTGVHHPDKYILYRAAKGFSNSLSSKYFDLDENRHTKYFNIHPGHLDDDNIRNKSAHALIHILKNVEEYKFKDYFLDSNVTSKYKQLTFTF